MSRIGGYLSSKERRKGSPLKASELNVFVLISNNAPQQETPPSFGMM
jgi:hypothetical protein